ncbi:MAG: hypothetical protein HFG15_03250 [Bacilli bacterium]|jgi:hypothetical protein|nr:hypothetical protein [Bacilli bacterium]
MNQKGFGKLEVMAFLVVVALSLTIVAILYNQVMSSVSPGGTGTGTYVTPDQDYENDDTANMIMADDYASLEKQIAECSAPYFLSNSQEGEVEVVTILTLVQNQYFAAVQALDDPDILCTGYVEHHKQNGTYQTYLKCEDEYETAGYDVLKDK